MRRREFIIALGGSALWPLAALGQHTAASRVVGLLGSGPLAAGRLYQQLTIANPRITFVDPGVLGCR